MSGQDYDNMAVVGQVADIVGAFKEAGSYLKRIRERRRSKPPPRGLVVDEKAIQDLEFSLLTGHETVRKHYEREYRRLGQPFATGDSEATQYLKTIYVDMQRGLVASLKFAYQHDQHVDFLPLQDVSDDSQDRTVMCLMQLHQRVLMNGDIMGSGEMVPRTVRPTTRPPQPQTQHSYSSLPDSQGRPKTDSSQLPTPVPSPFDEPTSFIRSSPSQHNSPFARPRPIEMPSNTSQTSLSNLPTPPLDKPPGPPPNAPLPRLPTHLQRRDTNGGQMERDTMAVRPHPPSHPPSPPQKETESAMTFLDDTFQNIESWWDKEDEMRQDREAEVQRPTGFEFQEPHPGTPVDPSRIGEPPSPRTVSHNNGDVDPTPSPLVLKNRLLSISPQNLLSPGLLSRRGDAGATADRPPTSSGLAGRDHRLSVTSNTTISSQSVGSSTSLPSRVTSLSSANSLAADSSVTRLGGNLQQTASSSLPGTSLSLRSGSVANVPHPIYESTATESQSTSGDYDVRRPSAPASLAGPRHQFSPFPSIQPPPIIERNPEGHHTSVRSRSSSNPSTYTGPLPNRTIAPTNADLSNSKVHLPCEANKFAGLCKAAWRAQIGDFKKAYSAEKKPGGHYSGKMIDFMRCKSCEFTGRVTIIDKKKRVPDRQILVAKDTGIAYRWDFLFKSHLALKGATRSNDAEYGCMFCCSEGRGTPVFKGMSAFISHVAEHRPGVAGNAVNNDLQVPDGPVVDRMDALVGRIMEPQDRWEIAFPAASGEVQYADTARTANSFNDSRTAPRAIPAQAY